MFFRPRCRGAALCWPPVTTHGDAKGTALMSEMEPGGGASPTHTRTHTAKNAPACHPAGERFKFQVGKAGTKVRGGSPLTAWC